MGLLLAVAALLALAWLSLAAAVLAVIIRDVWEDRKEKR